MSTLLCVPIKVTDAATALADARDARDAGADLVEFRLDDFLTGATGPEAAIEQDAVVALVGGSPLPCIVTCRPSGPEGGTYDGDEAARVALFERLAIAAGESEHPPRYIDVEWTTFERSANIRQKIKLAVDHPEQIRDLRTSLILSTHDFQGRPPDLFRRVAKMRGEPAAAVLKVAYLARSLRDNLDLFDLLDEAERPTIALAMGRFGLMSRVLAPKFGGFQTFASLRPATATAPGQPTLKELMDVYRFRAIGAATRVYGVVGFPLEHSISPAVHNAGFAALGAWRDAAGVEAGGVYLPLPVPPEYEHFKATVLAFLDHPRLSFSGCSVTIPHKEHLVRLAREQVAAGAPWDIDELALACGAANTLVIERGGGGAVTRYRVINTDGPAAVGCLSGELGDLTGKRIGIIGAGGVARAVAAGVLRERGSVVVASRTRERADSLAGVLAPLAERAGVKISAIDAGAMPTSFCDAYVNCTPVGMKGGPDPDASPLAIGELAMATAEAGGEPPVIMDTVYNPLETRLLRDAAAAGFRTIDGLGMFIRQAEMQFREWTGADPEPGLYERVAHEAVFGQNSG